MVFGKSSIVVMLAEDGSEKMLFPKQCNTNFGILTFGAKDWIRCPCPQLMLLMLESCFL